MALSADYARGRFKKKKKNLCVNEVDDIDVELASNTVGKLCLRANSLYSLLLVFFQMLV